MFTDVINKQAFEITCSNEATARQVQHDIASHTAQRFSNSMKDVFSTTGKKSGYTRIDKIEIDLGIMSADELGNAETVSRFKEILKRKIEDIHGTGSINSAGSTSSLENDLELLNTFITTGDLPWWVNKGDVLHMDFIIKKLMENHPEQLRRLFNDYSHNPQLLARLYTQLKPACVSLLTNTLPEFSVQALKDKSIKQSLQIASLQLSTEQWKKIRKILKKSTKKSFESRGHFLVDKLLELYNHLFLNRLSIEASALQKLLLQFGVTLFSNTEADIGFDLRQYRNLKQQLISATNLLTIFEVEVLIAGVSSFLGENEAVIYHSNLQDYDRVPTLSHNSNTESNQPYISSSWPEKKGSDINSGLISVAGNDATVLNISTAILIHEAQVNLYQIQHANAKANSDSDFKNCQPDHLTKERMLKEKDLYLPADEVSAEGKPGNLIIENAALPLRKAISYIIKKINCSDNVLLQYLQVLSATQLFSLAATFRKHSTEISEHKKLISHLLEHPFFMKYEILKLLPTLDPGKEFRLPSKERKPVKNSFSAKNGYSKNPPGQGDENGKKNDSVNEINRIKKPANKSGYQPLPRDLAAILRRIPTKDLYLVQDVMSKKRFDNDREKKLFKGIMLQLSKEDILLLSYLTELPQETLNNIHTAAAQNSLPAGERIDNAGDQFYQQNEAQNIQIENAGLCLLAVYLPGFFRQAGYLENGKFKNKNLAVRAVYLLQYIVTGTNKRPEYLLQFNKILCSLDPGEVIIENLRLTKKEKAEADALLASVIQNWKSLKATTVQGFRTSFLQRKGILYLGPSVLTLRIEKKGFDILLDTIPWSFNLVKLPWIKKIIQVEW